MEEVHAYSHEPLILLRPGWQKTALHSGLYPWSMTLPSVTGEQGVLRKGNFRGNVRPGGRDPLPQGMIVITGRSVEDQIQVLVHAEQVL